MPLVDEELEIGLRSIAVPIRDRSGRIVAAINVSTQSGRYSPAAMRREILPLLQRAAGEIEAYLRRAVSVGQAGAAGDRRAEAAAACRRATPEIDDPAAISRADDQDADGEQRPVVEPGDGDGDGPDHDRQEEGDEAGSHPDEAAQWNGMTSAITAERAHEQGEADRQQQQPDGAEDPGDQPCWRRSASLNIWSAGTLPTSTISKRSPAIGLVGLELRAALLADHADDAERRHARS